MRLLITVNLIIIHVIVCNDSVIRRNCAILVLLDLSDAFDTIDHDKLICILEKCVGMCGNALKQIKLYFSDRTQCVQIKNVLSFGIIWFKLSKFLIKLIAISSYVEYNITETATRHTV